MNTTVAPSESVPDYARLTHTEVVAKYGARWETIRIPYLQIIRIARTTGDKSETIMEIATGFERMAIEENLYDSAKFVIAAAVEEIEGRAA